MITLTMLIPRYGHAIRITETGTIPIILHRCWDAATHLRLRASADECLAGQQVYRDAPARSDRVRVGHGLGSEGHGQQHRRGEEMLEQRSHADS